MRKRFSVCRTGWKLKNSRPDDDTQYAPCYDENNTAPAIPRRKSTRGRPFRRSAREIDTWPGPNVRTQSKTRKHPPPPPPGERRCFSDGFFFPIPSENNVFHLRAIPRGTIYISVISNRSGRCTYAGAKLLPASTPRRTTLFGGEPSSEKKKNEKKKRVFANDADESGI